MAQDLVKSAARAFQIVEVFAAERRPMTAANLGQALNYPKSSLNVLLKSLVAQGYLTVSGPDLAYFPTLKLTHLGDWVPSALFGSESLLAELEELRDRTGETVTLSMPSDLHMRCLRALSGKHPIALQLDDGWMFPMFDTAVGRAYLATLNDAEVDALRLRFNALHPKSQSIAPAPLHTALSQVRDLGYSAAYDKVVPDTGAVAVAARSRAQSETLVVAVAGLNRRVKTNEVKIVRELKRWLRENALGEARRKST